MSRFFYIQHRRGKKSPRKRALEAEEKKEATDIENKSELSNIPENNVRLKNDDKSFKMNA